MIATLGQCVGGSRSTYESNNYGSACVTAAKVALKAAERHFGNRSSYRGVLKTLSLLSPGSVCGDHVASEAARAAAAAAVAARFD